MTAYVLSLLFLIPLAGGLAAGGLWLWRNARPGMTASAQHRRPVKVVETVPLGASGRLAVVEFEGKRLLLAVSRSGGALAEERTPEFSLLEG